MKNLKVKFWKTFNIILNVVIDIIFIVTLIWCFIYGYYITAILGILSILVNISMYYYEKNNICNNIYILLVILQVLIMLLLFFVCKLLNI